MYTVRQPLTTRNIRSWHVANDQTKERITGCLTPDTIVSIMISKKDNWDACADFIEKVPREKKANEHLVDYTRLRGAR